MQAKDEFKGEIGLLKQTLQSTEQKLETAENQLGEYKEELTRKSGKLEEYIYLQKVLYEKFKKLNIPQKEKAILENSFKKISDDINSKFDNIMDKIIKDIVNGRVHL